MLMTFSKAYLEFNKDEIIHSTLRTPYSFLCSIEHPIKVENVVVRPNGIDFEVNGAKFRDIDTTAYGITVYTNLLHWSLAKRI